MSDVQASVRPLPKVSGDEQRLFAVIGGNRGQYLRARLRPDLVEPEQRRPLPGETGEDGMPFCLITGVKPSGASTRSS